MASANYPQKGAQAKRKADGQIGVVYASDPLKDILTVRWPARTGFNTFVCSSAQFAHDWELTGKNASSRTQLAGAIVFPVIFGIFFYGWLTSGDHPPASSDPPSGRSNHLVDPSLATYVTGLVNGPFRDEGARNNWRTEAKCLPITDSNRQACDKFEMNIKQADEDFDNAIAQAGYKLESVERQINNDEAAARANQVQPLNDGSWDNMSETARKEHEEIYERAFNAAQAKWGPAREQEKENEDQALNRYWKNVNNIIESTKAMNSQSAH